MCIILLLCISRQTTIYLPLPARSVVPFIEHVFVFIFSSLSLDRGKNDHICY